MNDIAGAPAAEAARRSSAGRVRGSSGRLSKLTDAQKEYVVRRLAQYDSPTAIARQLREQLGLEISRQAIARYDPTRLADCARRWAELFYAARRIVIEGRAFRAVDVRPIETRRRERRVLRTVVALADRILKSVAAEGRNMLAKRPEQITDQDRLRVLVAFTKKLKATDPQGYATLRAALSDADGRAAAPPCAWRRARRARVS